MKSVWDLKVIGLLMGMQAGFTKYCCFLCPWDSRAVSQHYKQKDWGSRKHFCSWRTQPQFIFVNQCNLSIAVHAFASHVSMSFLVDETRRPR